jgi:hypothetical protein
MEALGLKNDSVIKASEALRAKEGATSSTDDQVSALKDSTKVSADADKQVDASIAQSNQLSDEAKVKFAEGTGLASKKWTPIQAALMSFSFCRFSNATGEI